MAKTTRSEARQATASPHFPDPDPRKAECPSRELITVLGESPPKVEYELTALGESLATALATFDAWVRDNAYVATNGDTFPGP